MTSSVAVDQDYVTFKTFKSPIDGQIYEYETTINNGKLQFVQPVFIQRYMAVVKILTDRKVNHHMKIVEFGCNTMVFTQHLKNLKFVEEICSVDIDEECLQLAKNSIAPLAYHYDNKINHPLMINIFAGSIVDNDIRVSNADAVVCIELIEHLYDDVLSKVPSAIFGFIRPQLAIFTTPNSEFNILFETENGKSKKFRHPDHKFEWTRQEFHIWANDIIKQYPEYEVSFYGVGPGPENTEHLGFCSQMAVFQRKAKLKQLKTQFEQKVGKPYKLIISHQIRWLDRTLTDKDHILKEISFLANHFQKNMKFDGKTKMKIPFSTLLPYIEYWINSEDQFNIRNHSDILESEWNEKVGTLPNKLDKIVGKLKNKTLLKNSAWHYEGGLLLMIDDTHKETKKKSKKK